MKKNDKINSNDKKFTYLIVAIIALALAVAAFAFISMSNGSTNKNETASEESVVSLAKCLTEKGYAMAGSESCSHCKAQKARFGDAFKYVKYYNCELAGDLAAWCIEKGVRFYPTWVAPDNELFIGEKELIELADLSGCPYTTA